MFKSFSALMLLATVTAQEAKVAAGVGAGGNAGGACDNKIDQKTWESVKANISTIQTTCVMQGAPGAAWYDHCIKKFVEESEPGHDKKGGEKCMTNCVAQRALLSTTCSACFGNMAGCTFKNCAMKCLDAKAQMCLDCCNQNCIPDFKTCSGISDLPPPTLFNSIVVTAEPVKEVVTAEPAKEVATEDPLATCAKPGDCGLAYQACCAGFAAKGIPCGCHLKDGDGKTGADCGTCGSAYSVCCAAFKFKGFPCTCDISSAGQASVVV